MDAAEKTGKGGWNMGPYEYVVESIAGEYAYLRRTDIYDIG